MSDQTIITVVQSIALVVIAWFQYRGNVALNQVRHNTNSLTANLVAKTGDIEYAKGQKAERDKQAAEDKL